MHSKSNNIEVKTYHNWDKIIGELFHSLLSRYQFGLETQMRGSDLIFDCVNLLYCKCHKIYFKCGSSHIDSPDWIKTKQATINPKNDDDKCFKYAARIALNHEKIESYLERVSYTKPFINSFD